MDFIDEIKDKIELVGDGVDVLKARIGNYFDDEKIELDLETEYYKAEKNTPLSDVIKSYGAEFTDFLAQIQAKATEELDNHCSTDDIGRDLKPAPAPAQERGEALIEV